MSGAGLLSFGLLCPRSPIGFASVDIFVLCSLSLGVVCDDHAPDRDRAAWFSIGDWGLIALVLTSRCRAWFVGTELSQTVSTNCDG